MHQRFSERTVFSDIVGEFQVAVDDNWLVLTSRSKIYFWNCHSMQHLDVIEVPDFHLGVPFIFDSTPANLQVVVIGFKSLEFPFVVLVDPTSKQVQTTATNVSITDYFPIFFKFQSRILFVIRGKKRPRIDMSICS